MNCRRGVHAIDACVDYYLIVILEFIATLVIILGIQKLNTRGQVDRSTAFTLSSVSVCELIKKGRFYQRLKLG